MPLDRDVIDIPDVLRPGFPSPANAQLSLRLGLDVFTPPNQPTTTIKLIPDPFSNPDSCYGAGKNGTPQLQLSKTTSVLGDDVRAGKRARTGSVIGKNGTPQLQPFETSSVFDDDVRAGKRVKMESESQLSVLEGEQKKSSQEIRSEKEHEAIRKKLEANRARRRSSVAHGGRKSGRISTGRPNVLGKPKPKPSRIGLLSSAKSLVQNVWNRGKAPVPAIASNIPKPTVTNVNTSSKSAASKTKMGPAPLGPKKKSSITLTHATTAVTGGSRIPLPVTNQGIASSDSTSLASANSIQQPATRRKPRISRSKVTARLALQKAARENGNGLNATYENDETELSPRASNDTSGGTRPNLDAKVSRVSHGGGTKSRASGEERVLLSAKKRARQSEYTRRKSKVGIAPLVLDGRFTGPVPSGMDVDR